MLNPNKAVTEGREEEVIRRFTRIKEIIMKSNVPLKDAIKQFAGVTTSGWQLYLKKGRVSQKTIDHMVAFTGLDAGVFDGTGKFDKEEEDAITKVFYEKVMGGHSRDDEDKKPDEVVETPDDTDEMTEETVSPDENQTVTEHPSTMEVNPVPDILVGTPIDDESESESVSMPESIPMPEPVEQTNSLIALYIKVLKETDNIILSDIGDAILITDTLRNKLTSKKAELEALEQLSWKQG